MVIHTQRIVKEYKKDLLKHFFWAEQKEMKWNWIDFVWKERKIFLPENECQLSVKCVKILLVDNLSRAFCIVCFSCKILLLNEALKLGRREGKLNMKSLSREKERKAIWKGEWTFLWPFVNYFQHCVCYLRDKHKWMSFLNSIQALILRMVT